MNSMDHVLDTPRWFETPVLGVTVREANFLANPRVPANVSGSVARGVRLPNRGHTASEVRAALRPYDSYAVIELAGALDLFCGFGDAALDRAFREQTGRLLGYKRTPFCYEDHVAGVPVTSPSTHDCAPAAVLALV
jgi:hypothetical protein